MTRASIHFARWIAAVACPTSRQMRNLRPLAARLAGNRRPRQLGAAGLHHERVLERIPRPFDVGRRRLLAVVAHVIADNALWVVGRRRLLSLVADTASKMLLFHLSFL